MMRIKVTVYNHVFRNHFDYLYAQKTRVKFRVSCPEIWGKKKIPPEIWGIKNGL